MYTIAHCLPSRTLKLSDQLRELNIKHSCPTVVQTRRLPRRRKVVKEELPILPGFLFLQDDPPPHFPVSFMRHPDGSSRVYVTEEELGRLSPPKELFRRNQLVYYTSQLTSFAGRVLKLRGASALVQPEGAQRPLWLPLAFLS